VEQGGALAKAAGGAPSGSTPAWSVRTSAALSSRPISPLMAAARLLGTVMSEVGARSVIPFTL
jgi:5-enolpyruvylshikimate-3-phosphate synthase